MMTELKALLTRSSATLLEDAVGVASLFSLLIAALYLPSAL